jgi:hypothetical protein
MPYYRPPFSIVAAILSALLVVGALAQTGTTQGDVPKNGAASILPPKPSAAKLCSRIPARPVTTSI